MPALRPFVAVLVGFAACATSLISIAQNPKQLKSAATTPTTVDAKVPITLPYRIDMASQAHLDPLKPQLSTSGFLSQNKPALASSECLLAQTILEPQGANANLTADQVKTLCASLNVAATPEDAARALKVKDDITHAKDVPTIDYALIHIVRWDLPKAGDVSKATEKSFADQYCN